MALHDHEFSGLITVLWSETEQWSAVSKQTPKLLRPELQAARMSKIKDGGLDQYGALRSEVSPFGVSGSEGNKHTVSGLCSACYYIILYSIL